MTGLDEFEDERVVDNGPVVAVLGCYARERQEDVKTREHHGVELESGNKRGDGGDEFRV